MSESNKPCCEKCKSGGIPAVTERCLSCPCHATEPKEYIHVKPEDIKKLNFGVDVMVRDEATEPKKDELNELISNPDHIREAAIKGAEDQNSTTPSWEAEFDRKFKTPGHKLYQRETMANEIKAFIQSLLDRQREELAPRSLYRNRVTITIKIADDKNQEVIQVIRGLDEITCSSEQIVPILLEDTLQKIVSGSKILNS